MCGEIKHMQMATKCQEVPVISGQDSLCRMLTRYEA